MKTLQIFKSLIEGPVKSLVKGPVKSLVRNPIKSLVGVPVKLTFSLANQSIKSLKFATFNTNAWMRGGVIPAVEAAQQMNRVVQKGVLDASQGKRTWSSFRLEVYDRIHAGYRYSLAIKTLGKQIFGSAKFDGETVIAEDGPFQMSYIPPSGKLDEDSKTPKVIFHASGAIPYGDQIFRLTPDHNLFGRFLERGIGIYAMELKKECESGKIGDLSMDALIDIIKNLSDKAFEHNEQRKMLLEGYCGHGTQAMAYLAAMPEDAERKFSMFCAFVSPIDGSRCTRLADGIQSTPANLTNSLLWLWKRLGGTVPGDSLRIGLDMSLGALYHKTRLGYFNTGWLRPDLLAAQQVKTLSTRHKRDLAGSYWVSPESARRFPVPVDITKFTNALFTEGISPQGDLPWSYKGNKLTLADVAEKTTFPIAGFFGELDEIVPPQTAHILPHIFGDRYTHVVHPKLGHISYILSPAKWKKGHARSLDPNPVDIMMAGFES